MKEKPETISNIDIDFFKDIQNGGNEFYIFFDGVQNEKAEIIEINEFPSFHGINRTPFSVTIAVQSTLIYPQKIYQVLNHKDQLAEIFLVPVAKNEKHVQYQADFT